MRRFALVITCSALLFAACGSDKKAATPGTTTPTTVPGTAAPTSTSSPPASSTAVTTTTSVACPNTGSTGPRSTTSGQPDALLTKVTVTTAGCRDSVTFLFEKSGVAVPSCTVAYKPGPFSNDGSGAPVAVAGAAFAVVTCSPASGFDFEAGTASYTGPKRITPTGTRHVRAVVETGDFEGTLTWVIGLNAKRAFAITAGGTPDRQLIVTFQ